MNQVISTTSHAPSRLKNVIYFLTFFIIFWLDFRVALQMGVPVSATTVMWCMTWPALLAISLRTIPPAKRFLVLGIALIAMTLLSAIDKTYFAYFQSLPSTHSLQSMHQMLDVHSSIYMLLSLDTLTPILAGISLLFYSRKQKKTLELSFAPTSGTTPLRQYAALALLSFVTVTAFLPSNSQGSIQQGKDIPDWVNRYSPTHYVAGHGIMVYHMNDILSSIGRNIFHHSLPDERKSSIDAYLSKQYEINLQPTPLFGIAKGRNVVFIQLESWAEFLVDLSVDKTAVTPFFSALKESGLYFENIYDVTLHGRTSDAEFAVMTGLLPDTRKPAQMSHMQSYFLALPEILKQAGYHTMTVHGLDGEIWNQKNAHKRYGIEDLYFSAAMQGKETLGLGISDKEIFNYALEKMDKAQTPYFNFIISLTSHHPFIDIPEAYKKNFSHMKLEDGYGLLPYYLRSVKYTDDVLADFFLNANQQANFANTLFVIYGDHDSGTLGTEKTVNNIDIFAPKNDKVPLLFYIPGEEEKMQQYRNVVQHQFGGLHDVPATLLHLLGITPPKGLMGTNLINTEQPERQIPLPASPLMMANSNGVSINDGHSNIRAVYDQQLMAQEILDYKLLQSTSPH